MKNSIKNLLFFSSLILVVTVLFSLLFGGDECHSKKFWEIPGVVISKLEDGGELRKVNNAYYLVPEGYHLIRSINRYPFWGGLLKMEYHLLKEGQAPEAWNKTEEVKPQSILLLKKDGLY